MLPETALPCGISGLPHEGFYRSRGDAGYAQLPAVSRGFGRRGRASSPNGQASSQRFTSSEGQRSCCWKSGSGRVAALPLRASTSPTRSSSVPKDTERRSYEHRYRLQRSSASETCFCNSSGAGISSGTQRRWSNRALRERRKFSATLSLVVRRNRLERNSIAARKAQGARIRDYSPPSVRYLTWRRQVCRRRW